MRALRFARYGSADVLHVEDMPEPPLGGSEARVRVHAVALNPLDYKVREGALRLFPVFRGPPRGLGCDYAGVIVALGGGATGRHVGERVFGSLLPFGRDGALAELIAVPYARMVPLPADVDFASAASLPIAGGTALQALADEAALAPGQRVLITGAAGGVGHFAVQIAKHMGAEVVAVCSAGNVEFVRSLGADEIVDYAQADFTCRDDRFDVVFDAAGVSSFAASRRLLTESGVYINTGGTAGAVLNTVAASILTRITSKRRAIAIVLRNGPAMWSRLLAMLQAGTLRVHVERVVALEEVAAAQQAMESGHGRGKVVARLA